MPRSPYEVVISIWEDLVLNFNHLNITPGVTPRERALSRAFTIAYGTRIFAAHGWTWASIEEEIDRQVGIISNKTRVVSS